MPKDSKSAQVSQEDWDTLTGRVDALESKLAAKKPSAPAEVPYRRAPGAAQHAQFNTTPEKRAELEKKYGKKPKASAAPETSAPSPETQPPA